MHQHGFGIRRVGFLTALAAISVLISITQASAHASYVSSNPADKQVLAKSPAQLTITFVSPIVPGDGTFATVTNGDTDAVAAPAVPSPTDPKTLVVPLQPNLPNGKYLVFWKSTDADDHGVTFGRFSFFIGNPSPSDVTAAEPGASIAVPDDATQRALSPVGTDFADPVAACGSDSWCAYCATHPDSSLCPKRQ